MFTLTGSFDHSDINKKRLTNMSGKPRDNEGNREGATDLKEELNKKVKKTSLNVRRHREKRRLRCGDVSACRAGSCYTMLFVIRLIEMTL